MEQIPDAPWIRDTELNGYPEMEPVCCPVCGEECDTLFTDKYGDVVGCEECMGRLDAYKWAEERRREQEEDQWDDSRGED